MYTLIAIIFYFILFLIFHDKYLYQNLTLWSGNVNTLLTKSEHERDITSKLDKSVCDTFVITAIADTLKMNPTTANSAEKNPKIRRKS